ncbi:nuclear pore glycoprotein p62 [Anopheles bellator]|uniref:nuclear pore glycoprotein p62 n=1 Tax=Anopheles bellator TaxID=139047 RepID=UPI0026494385|nr:nuclear pore glycoprotein p62 [Anopheles bellator]
MNFSFGTPTTTTASAGGFSLGAPTTTSTAATGFSFGSTPTFGATGNTAPSAAAPSGSIPTLSFGASLGATTQQPNTASTLPTFGSLGAAALGGTVATSNPVAPVASNTASIAATTPANVNPLASSVPTPAITTSVAAPAPAPLTLGGFGLPKPAEQSAPAAAATTTGQPATLSLGTANTTAPPATGTTGPAVAASLTTTTQTTQSAAVPTGQQLKFFQLEEFINKWTLELEEQEKLFTNQATQVNAWDNMLLSNSEKIVTLNEAVTKVKAEQNAMEQELEFITAQHTELEECIVPLEQELSRITQIDLERGQTYSMAETLDSQLKQMYEDLKEVIEHLNDAYKYTDPNDPLVQIGKILNAHMNSLQWIESSSTAITNRLEEINKMHETLRKDNERSFRLTYYDQ